MTTPENGAEETAPTPAPRPEWLRTAIPHIITATLTIAVMLVILWFWTRPTPAAFVPLPTAQPTALAPTSQPTTPVPTSPPLSAGVTRQEIADLRTEDDRLWATVFLLKAVNQVAEAETLLRSNDTPSVDQALIAADYSLSRAYERADESQKSPIDQLRRNVDRIRGDLYLYPERMDTRLAQLRQLLLTLVDDPRS